jgi:hypothetical protein
MIRPKKLSRDANQRAQQVAKLLTGEIEAEKEPERSAVSAYLAEIGRKGGLKGGKARAAKLSKARRKAIAKKASDKRWKSPPNKIVATESS